MGSKSFYDILVNIQANTASFEQGMKNATRLVQSATDAIDASMKKLNANINSYFKNTAQGIAQGFGQQIERTLVSSIKALTTEVGALADEGHAVAGVAESFKTLGGTATMIDQASQALKGTVSSFDLMRFANEAFIRRVPELNKNFAAIVEYGARWAQANNKDVVPSIDNLIKALGNPMKRSLAQFGLQVTDGADRSTKMREAIQSLMTNMQSLAPVIDDAGNAHTRFVNALSDVRREIGLGVDQSVPLRDAWKDLSKQLQDIDWVAVGKGLADIEAQIIQMLPSIRTLVGLVLQGANGLGLLLGADLSKSQAFHFEINKQAEDLAALKNQRDNGNTVSGALSSLGSLLNPAQLINGPSALWGTNGMSNAYMDQIIAQKQAALDSLIGLGKRNGFLDDPLFANNSAAAAMLKGVSGDGTKPHPLDPADPANAAAAKKLEAEQRRLATEFAKDSGDKYRDELTRALKEFADTGAVDSSGFQELQQKLAESTKQAFIAGHQQYLDDPGISQQDKDHILQLAQDAGDKASQDFQDKFFEASKKIADDLKKKQEEAYKESIDTWRGLFEDAITGNTMKFSDMLKEVAVGFAAELANAVFGSVGNLLKSPQNIGGALGQGLLGSILGGSGASSGGLGGIVSGAMGGGMFAGAGGIGSGLTSLFGLGGTELGPGTAGVSMLSSMGIGAQSAGAIAGAMPVVGAAALGGAALYGIDDHFGVFGHSPKNPDTIGRNQVAGYLENLFGHDFTFGDTSHRFNDGGGWGNFHNMPQSSQDQFSILGEGLKNTLGIAQDIGPQIGAILAENLNGNLEKAKLLFHQLGLSADDMKKAITQMGLQGKKTWSEIQQLQGALTQVSQPGPAKQGDYASGFNMFLGSGNTGVAALLGIRNAGIGLLQSGVHDLRTAQSKLNGQFNPSDVSAFFGALKQAGIKNVDDWAKANQDTLAQIAAFSQNLGVNFDNVSASAQAAASGLNSIAGLGGVTVPDISLADTPDTLPGVKPAAKKPAAKKPSGDANLINAVLSGKTKLLQFPRMPSTGSLGSVDTSSVGGADGGVGGTVVHINIDATGAQAGVEHNIKAAAKTIEENVVQRIAKTMTIERYRRAGTGS